MIKIRDTALESNKTVMATTDKASDDSLYPIAVLIDELKNEDIQVGGKVWSGLKNGCGKDIIVVVGLRMFRP